MGDGVKTEDRGPLFPGSSCFPLSPDHKHKTDYKYHTRGKHDQLNMIFNLLGTPTDSDIDQLERDDAKRYIRCFAKRDGEGLRSKFPHVEQASTEMLEQMLHFNPIQRITVDQSLTSRLFAEVRDKTKESTAPSFITLD